MENVQKRNIWPQVSLINYKMHCMEFFVLYCEYTFSSLFYTWSLYLYVFSCIPYMLSCSFLDSLTFI
jgi:hypothetical protein